MPKILPMKRALWSKKDVASASQPLNHTPFDNLLSGAFPDRPIPEPLEKDQPQEKKQKAKKGRVVLRRETAQRGGKTVIVVGQFEDFILQDEIEELGRLLKKTCGCGGCVKEREIEIQGELVPRIREFLTGKGFRVAGVS